MAKEEGIFTVSEDEKLQDEVIVVAEEDLEVTAAEMTVPMGYPMGHGMGPGPMAPQEKKEDDSWRSSKLPKHFDIFLVKEMNRLPKPNSILGNRSKMEKALGQYRKLDSYISQALQSDYDDDINTEKVDNIRKVVEQVRDQLEDALDSLSHATKQRRKTRKRRGEDDHDGLKKEGTTPHFNGFQMVITPLQRAITGALINGTVSGGRDLEELWKDAKKKYKMDDREELEILQILADFGHPEFRDRLRLGDDNDPTRDEGHGEWQSNYFA